MSHQMFAIVIISICCMQTIHSSTLLSEFDSIAVESSEPLHEYACNSTTGYCTRHNADNATASQAPFYAYHARGLHLCAMMCGRYRTLWPQPSGVTRLGNRFVAFDLDQLGFEPITANVSTQIRQYLSDIADIFRANIRRDSVECPACIVPYPNASRVTVRFELLKPTDATTTLDWSTDESYTLDVHTTAASSSNAVDDSPSTASMGNLIVGANVLVQINASTIFGLRHGLETLGQLIAQSTDSTPATTNDLGVRHTSVILNAAKITDRPAFAHRGLLLDTARNPLSLDDLERTLRGMATTKLNVLHWHATDTQSFSLDLPSLPAMATLGAYSRRQLFDADAVRHVVAYALRRGVRVLLEIDAPSHVGNGWQWGPSKGLGNLTVCADWQPWRKYCIQPPCGQLNPANGNMYDVLRRVYEDVKRSMLPGGERLLHMGGDEVFFGCWNASAEVVEYMRAKGWGREREDFLQLWSEFQANALQLWTDVVRENGGDRVVEPKTILWSSQLTDPATIGKYLPRERYIVQTWVPNTDDMPGRLLAQGYELIVSTKNAWYFDHGFWGQTAYYTWSRAYDNRIPKQRGVLGGEACVWTELIDGQTLDGRVWPRAAAVAERLWSNPTTAARQVMERMYRLRERLVRAGLAAEAVAPKWCVQNEGMCL